MIESKKKPNFRFVEYVPPVVDYEEFKEDFCNCFMTIPEIKEKYNLTNSEFAEFRKRVLEDTGLKKKPTYTYRPVHFFESDTYIQKKNNGYIIVRKFMGHAKYFGRYVNYDIAKMVRDKLVECDWDESVAMVLMEKYGLKKATPMLDYAKEVYPQFKELYINSDYKVSEIMELLGLTQRGYRHCLGMIHDEYGMNYRRSPRK